MSKDPIVVGTDGSATAEVAVERAADMAEALGAAVLVVSASSRAEDPAAEAIVAEARDRLQARGVNAQTRVRAGDPGETLVRIAEEDHAQMIVVGNRGMTGARRVLGSVPNHVSHRARCDVLIVATTSRIHAGEAAMMTAPIVVGTDGSNTATQAVEEAVRLAGALDAELHIVSGYTPLRGAQVSGAPPGEAIGWAPLGDSFAETTLSTAAALARARGVKVATHAREGDPVDALLQVAGDSKAAMIVVGSRGMHGTQRLTFNNVANQISHKAPCNVLIVATDQASR